MKIQANPSGTRSIEVTEKHLETIDKYALLRNLIDSNGIIDEAVLDKLRLNVRALLEGSEGSDRDVLDLCLDVLYNKNMKAFGLHELVLLYINWKTKAKRRRAKSLEKTTVEAHAKQSEAIPTAHRLPADNEEGM